MLVLAIAAGFAGIACIIEMLVWCVETWKEGDREDKIARFEKNSDMMRNKETFKLGE